jgi:hypothetical protein
MIHYACDLCKRPLDPEDDLRYIVKVEVAAAFDPVDLDESDLDADNLQALSDIIERLDDEHDEAIGDDVAQTMRFDLCPECRKRFMKNPLGRKPTEQFDFSKN